MRSEDLVPIEERVLLVAERLSALQVEALRAQLPQAIERRDSTSPADVQAVDDFLAWQPSASQLAVVIVHAYADLPLGKSFAVCFRGGDVATAQPTLAILRHAIVWGVPCRAVAHGHHQACIVEFPNGVPPMIAELQPDMLPQRSQDPIGLCSRETWQRLCEKEWLAVKL